MGNTEDLARETDATSPVRHITNPHRLAVGKVPARSALAIILVPIGAHRIAITILLPTRPVDINTDHYRGTSVGHHADRGMNLRTGSKVDVEPNTVRSAVRDVKLHRLRLPTGAPLPSGKVFWKRL
jgi:hypothetical protein